MMRKRWIYAAAFLFLIGSLGTFIVFKDTEPKYQGIGLRTWLRRLSASPLFGSAPSAMTFQAVVYVNKNASNQLVNIPPPAPLPPIVPIRAVQAIGTNAIPTLIHLLQAEDARIKANLIRWINRQSWNKKRFETADVKRQQGLAGFQALGTNASPAIPKLVRMLDNPGLYEISIKALQLIGPPASSAFIQALDSKNPPARIEAAKILSEEFANVGADVVSALAQRVDDPDPRMRHCVLWGLGLIAAEPAIAVPALMRGLNETNAMLRIMAIESLGRFGSEAKPALPALTALAQDDPEAEVRPYAKAVLHGIDRSTARR